jgi:hypothetical protein
MTLQPCRRVFPDNIAAPAVELKYVLRAVTPLIRSGSSAVVFGEGDFRTPTENRSKPPALERGDELELGPLRATVVRLLNHPRFISLQFDPVRDVINIDAEHNRRPKCGEVISSAGVRALISLFGPTRVTHR